MKQKSTNSKNKLFLNRELSLLKFNQRVLNQAEDKRVPLLERVRFLQIFYSNMDEFFMKRVGSLKRYTLSLSAPLLIDNTTANYQLKLIHKQVLELNKQASTLFNIQILPQLLKEDIKLLSYKELSKKQKIWAEKFFKNKMFPVLTPIAVDHTHPFPLISTLSLSLAVKLFIKKNKDPLFARVKIPEMFSWIPLFPNGSKKNHFLSPTELVIKHLQDLFPEMKIASVMPFRITRNLDIENESEEEEDAEDLLEFIEEEIRRRKFAEIVRLEHGPHPDTWLLAFLKKNLKLDDQDVYELPWPLDYVFLKSIANIQEPKLKYSPFQSLVTPQWTAENNIFDLIKRGDLLVHHPFESFSATVEKFIVQAVHDPQVVAIKMTLYRTNEDSSIIEALILAAKKGKQVVCIVELKARLDEEKNIEWAHKMEKAGVHVVYGLIGLKTHSKLSLIIKKEKDNFKPYVHIGTGNYHSQTAKFYTDTSLFTCHKEIAQDAIELFHYLTGRSQKKTYKHLLVSPVQMEQKFLKLIRQEQKFALEGKPAEIFVKINNLEAPKIIKALYEASSKGVKIKLIVRGICCLRPGLKGLSENIEVKSILGRFLEHSRIFFFRGGQEDITKAHFFIGSSDWMKRNLYSRVELVSPVYDKKAIKELWKLLNILWKDKSSSWHLKADGSYLHPLKPEHLTVHDQLLENFNKKIKGLDR